MTTAWCAADEVRSLTGAEWLAASWALGLATMAVLLVARRRAAASGAAGRGGGPGTQGARPAAPAATGSVNAMALGSWWPTEPRRVLWVAAGFGVLSVPAWMAVVDTIPDLVRTVCARGDVVSILPGVPPAPPPAWHFSDRFVRAILHTLAYVAIGGALVLQGRDPAWWRRPTVARVAQGLAGLLPLPRGEGASMRWGLALFPILALGNLALAWIVGLDITTATDAPYWSNMTPYTAVLLATAAAVGEELVYRGVMLQGLLRLLQPRLGAAWGFAAALTLQAIPFAYTHAGYGDPGLLLFAFLFAILAGLAAQFLGIWCAILLHGLVDFYAFYLAVPEPGMAFTGLAIAIGAVSVAASILQLRRAVRRRTEARP